MRNRARHVLFHRPTLWAADVQCSTKVLARLFAEEGLAVTYMQSPLDPIHLMRGKGYLSAWRDSPRMEGGVRIVTPATPLPVRDIWPLGTRQASYLRYRLAMPSLPAAIARDDTGDPDLVWTTVPGSAPALRGLFPKAHIAFHVVDYYPAFRGEAVRSLERADYAAADEVWTIGQSLADYVTGELGTDPDKVAVLGQGVETESYALPLDEPAEIAGLPRPRTVWTGVMSKGDPDLFRAAASAIKHRGGSLVLIGPPAPWAEALRLTYPETVHLLGPRAPTRVPAYLMASDIGLMLYARDKSEVYRGQNPLKLFEYAAAGLGIVSTPHDEYRHLSPPVEIVNTPDEVSEAVALLANERDTGKSEAARAFARQHDWRQKVRWLIARQFPELEKQSA